MCFRVTLVTMVLLYVGHSMWPDPLPGGGGDSVAVSGIRLYIHVGQSLLCSCYLCVTMSRHARGTCMS